jgi:hypothetical protein
MKSGPLLRLPIVGAMLVLSLRLLGCGGGEPLLHVPDAGQPVDASAIDAFTPPPPDGPSGTRTCSAPSPCGTAGTTTEECTTTDATDTCTAIVYETSDGHEFACASCASCMVAQEQLASYCAEAPPPPPPPLEAGTSCTAPSSCGGTGSTYSTCTTTDDDGTCTGISYKTSTGGAYSCASCSDCSAALAALTAHCTSVTCTTPATCTASSTYDLCTTTGLSGACISQAYKTSTGNVFACSGCSNCASAEASLDSACPAIGATCGNCTTDAQCQLACPAVVGGGTNCCDVGPGVCYATAQLTCPVPSDGGTE